MLIQESVCEVTLLSFCVDFLLSLKTFSMIAGYLILKCLSNLLTLPLPKITAVLRLH